MLFEFHHSDMIMLLKEIDLYFEFDFKYLMHCLNFHVPILGPAVIP